MGPEWLELLVAILAFWFVVRGVFWLLDDERPKLEPGVRLRDRRAARRGYAEPSGRPIEVIAAEARLLAVRVHNPPRGISFAKYSGWQSAYDRVLAEGCRALELEHLLEVLEPGDELDRERGRVESLLWVAGLRIDEAA